MFRLINLKQAQVDPDGSIRLVWWVNNEKMKGAAVLPPLSQSSSRIPVNNRNGTILEMTTGSSCAGGSVLIYPSATTAPSPSPPAPRDCVPPATAADASAHRFWRIGTSASLGNRWDICSVDFFGSIDSTGRSLVNHSHGAPVSLSGSAGGEKPQDVIGVDPLVCNLSNMTTWAKRWGASPMPGWIGWDFAAGQACLPCAWHPSPYPHLILT